MSNLATGSRTKSPNGLLAGHLLRAVDRDLLREAARPSRDKHSPVRLTGTGSMVPAREVVDLNERIRRLSTLLSAVSGPGNDLRIGLCDDPVLLHSAPEQLDLALIEAAAHMRGLLSSPGTIVLRTKRVNHQAILALGAREDGGAVFKFGSLRMAPREAPASLFGAVRRLAVEAHGRLRFQAPSTLILRLPTVLKLAAGKRSDISLPTHPSQTKEMIDEQRQPVAA